MYNENLIDVSKYKFGHYYLYAFCFHGGHINKFSKVNLFTKR